MIYRNTSGTIIVNGNCTGSSGSCTGNAATATKLATARNINGTAFDGSAAITTANWGTARTIKIGATGKSVNGSANVTWTRDEVVGTFAENRMFWSKDGLLYAGYHYVDATHVSIGSTAANDCALYVNGSVALNVG